MIDDILASFKEWFIDSFDTDPYTSEVNIEQNSMPTYFDGITDNFLNNPIHNTGTSTKDLSSFNLVNDFPQALDWFKPDNHWGISSFEGIGYPVEESQHWQQQQGSSSCAVVAQISVFESITGVCMSEEQACHIADKNGWFDPDIGTRPSDVGKLLNQLGVATEQKYDATLLDIADALEKGDRIIVGLDANEIWHPMRDKFGSPIEQPDAGHAVWVTGIDTKPDGSVKVILNDSGTPNGKMEVVDAVDFLNAWEDYGNFLVTASEPDQYINA